MHIGQHTGTCKQVYVSYPVMCSCHISWVWLDKLTSPCLCTPVFSQQSVLPQPVLVVPKQDRSVCTRQHHLLTHPFPASEVYYWLEFVNFPTSFTVLFSLSCVSSFPRLPIHFWTSAWIETRSRVNPRVLAFFLMLVSNSLSSHYSPFCIARNLSISLCRTFSFSLSARSVAGFAIFEIKILLKVKLGLILLSKLSNFDKEAGCCSLS